MKFKITRTPENVWPPDELEFGEYDNEIDRLKVSMINRKNDCQDYLNKREIQEIIDWLTLQIR